MTRIPATIVTGFLGAGKTTLLSHLASNPGGRRIAFIVNEFGDIGVDGSILAGCTLPGCDEADVIELANGCICCTVADDFLPTIEGLLSRPVPPDHIVIETSGLALPKPLVEAFSWPEVSARVTVDAVVTVVDAEAAAAGRFAPNAEAPTNQAATAVDAPAHQQELHELFGDQVACADLVLLTKTDRIDGAAEARARVIIDEDLRAGVRVLKVTDGRIAPELLLGLGAAAESDLAARASHHDLEGHGGGGGEEADHGHDAFRSFALPLPEVADPAQLLAKVERLFAAAPIFRVKGFVAVAGKPMRYLVQGVGGRASGRYDRPWGSAPRSGNLVVIGAEGIDRAALAALIEEA